MKQVITFIKGLINKKIVIFGTGNFAEIVNTLINIANAKVSYYIDNDPSKWGTDFYGFKVNNPDDLLLENKNEIVILISSMYFEEISIQLEGMGYIRDYHFFSVINVYESLCTTRNISKNELFYYLNRDITYLIDLYYEKIFVNEVNLSGPFEVKKWLSLFIDDPISGIRLNPNTRNQSNSDLYLTSNDLGLRGPSNTNAEIVIFGNSFAFGLGIEDCMKWYDYLKNPENYLNLGLMSSPSQVKSLFDNLYTGPKKTAIVMYHPLSWAQAKKHFHWKAGTESYISSLNWPVTMKKSLDAAVYQYQRFVNDLKSNRLAIYEYNNLEYYISYTIAYFNFKENEALVKDYFDVWRSILSSFKKVLFIQIPVTQNIVSKQHFHPNLNKLIKNYEYGWNIIEENLKDLNGIYFYKPDFFNLDDYYQFDIHWNSKGHKKFGEYINSLIDLD